MKLFSKILILLIVCISMAGCSLLVPERGDYSFPTSGKYKIARTSSNEIQLLKENGQPSKDNIGTKVTDLAWNEKFILIKQLGVKTGTDQGSKPELIAPTPNEGEIQYWIIDVDKSKRSGPFKDIESFSKEREALNVPKKLELKPVESYVNNKK